MSSPSQEENQDMPFSGESEDEYAQFVWSLQPNAEKSSQDLEFSVQEYLEEGDVMLDRKRARVENAIAIENEVGETQDTPPTEGVGDPKQPKAKEEWEDDFLRTFSKVLSLVITVIFSSYIIPSRTNVGAPASWP